MTTNYGALPETCGEFATMIEFDSSGQNLVERYADTLNSVIDNYKNGLYKEDLEMQTKYYSKYYSWEIRIKEWINFLNYARSQKKHIKLFVATPAFGHMVTTNYMNSMMKFVSHSHPRLAVSTALHLQSGMALVTQARNNCVASFLNSDCSHMLFVDSDIGFEPEAVYRLLEKDVPLCLTPYPVKGYGPNHQLQFIVISQGFLKF